MRPAVVGPKEPDAHALRRLGGAGVIDRVVAETGGHGFAGGEPGLDLLVRQVAGHRDRAGERQPGADRIARELGPDFRHRAVEVERRHLAAEHVRIRLRQEARRVPLQGFKEDAVARDPGQGLPVGRAGDAEPDRQRGAVARQADHAHIVAEILAAELRPDAHGARRFQDQGLRLPVAVGRSRAARPPPAGRRDSRCWPVSHRLQVELRRCAANDDRQMVGRGRRRCQACGSSRR